MARIVAIDFGLRRVGIAVADPLSIFAQPHGTFSPDEAVAELARLAGNPGISTVVVGWPLLPDGEEGPMTDRVQEFINRIRKRLPGVTFEKWDETYTSASAGEVIRTSGAKQKKRREKGVLDRVAAAIILQEYLDSAGDR